MANGNLYERLKDYRVDFAYSKELYFAASMRLKKEYEKKERRSRNLNLVAAGLSILTLSNLFLFLQDEMGKNAVYIASVVSIVGIIISIYLFFHRNPEEFKEYQQRGEAYLMLFKEVKNIEAMYLDKIITDEALAEEIKMLAMKQERLSANALATLEEDYLKAKSNIAEGRLTKTEEEIQNTK